eukprot:COSAG05_NODE_2304_length_3250_cov_3.541098_3_plen_256_part_00
MAKKGKKKGGGKGKKGGKKKKTEEPPAPAPAPEAPKVRKVIVNYEMFPGSAPWNFLDFSEVVFVKTRVFRLRDSIVDRHGGGIHRSDVSLYLNAASRRLDDELKMLQELDPPVKGFVDGEEEEQITIYYDFNPPQSDKNDGLDTSFSTLGPRPDQTNFIDGESTTLPRCLLRDPNSCRVAPATESWTCPLLLSDPVAIEAPAGLEQPAQDHRGSSTDFSRATDESAVDVGLEPVPLIHRPSTSLGFRSLEKVPPA